MITTLMMAKQKNLIQASSCISCCAGTVQTVVTLDVDEADLSFTKACGVRK